jgi:predicted ribosome quality control (RQC) complex YloA/Tae2 family protein
MKKNIAFSNFDVFAVTKELDAVLAQGKIDNVYEINGELLILKIKTKLNEKKILIVKNDTRINFTDYNYPVPKYPSQYIISLRKLLKNRKILSINQYNFDRIIVFELSDVEGKPWKFVIELFNKGNYILLNENNLVKVAKSYSKYKDRDILANREYIFPKSRGKDFLTITKEDFEEILHEFEGELVRVLARNINISGHISEEICLKAGVGKNRLGKELDQSEIDSLFSAFKTLRNQLLFGELTPSIVLNEKGEEIAVLPFDLTLYKKNQKRRFKSFNEAVDEFFSKIDSAKLITPQDQSINQKIKSQEKILENQREYLEELKRSKEMYYEQGAFIYANFNDIQKLFDVINKAREKGHNLAEIDTKLQNAKNDNFKDLIYFVKIIPATRQMVISINNREVYLDLNKTIGENANIIYNKGKKAEKKLKGTLPAIEKTEEKIKKLTFEKESIELDVDFLIKRPTKKWYEKLRWFISSDGFLVIGGRDASSNEAVFKKHITPNDLIFHTNFPGSPLAVIKNPENKIIPENSIKETANFVASYSMAWKENWGVVDVFYVLPEQVSKTPPSGEFLPKGSFMISGKKNLIKNAKTELALTLKFLLIENESDSEAQIYYPQILCRPTNAFKSTRNLVVIRPSKSGSTKGKLAKEIKAIFLKIFEGEKRKWVNILPLDDIILVLPNGTTKIKELK